MRVGSNPARFVENVAQPAEITVTVVNFIPFLSGYYEHSLDVLKTVVESLDASRSTQHPFDVMLFDNHSCTDVQEYLQECHAQGKIQYLILSDTNIGKLGAWNFMFSAAQGKYIVFADGDIGFRQGWLEASLELFNTFPDVGMVTARPYRPSNKVSESTMKWAQGQGKNILEMGKFIPWETFWEHAQSIGFSEEQARSDFNKEDEFDFRLSYHGKTAFIGAGHFQFMSRREVLQKVIPLPSLQPMRGERGLDDAVDKMGCLRLTTDQAYIWHIGNRLPEAAHTANMSVRKDTFSRRLLQTSGVRRLLMWIYNQIFHAYFDQAR